MLKEFRTEKSQAEDKNWFAFFFFYLNHVGTVTALSHCAVCSLQSRSGRTGHSRPWLGFCLDRQRPLSAGPALASQWPSTVPGFVPTQLPDRHDLGTHEGPKATGWPACGLPLGVSGPERPRRFWLCVPGRGGADGAACTIFQFQADTLWAPRGGDCRSRGDRPGDPSGGQRARATRGGQGQRGGLRARPAQRWLPQRDPAL